MKEGRAYLFDNANRHFVKNPSTRDRIHLIFDTVGSVELYKLIKQSTVIRSDGREHPFATTAGATESLQKRDIMAVENTGEPVGLAYENWVDAEVFEPMSPDEIHRNLLEYVLPMVAKDDSIYTPLKALFVRFLQRWEKKCFVPLKGQQFSRDSVAQLRKLQLTCQTLSRELLMSVLDLDICSEKGKASLKSGGKLVETSLSTIVESILRMVFYECTGWRRYAAFETRGPPCLPGRRVPTPLGVIRRKSAF